MPAEFATIVGAVVRGPDKYASQGGAYHAARSSDGRARKHEGIDLLAQPGQPILAPCVLKVVRRADPYDDKKDTVLSGLLLEAMDGLQIKLLYVEPIPGLIGHLVTKGTVIGHAQSLQHLYPGIQDHVHAEIWIHQERVDPTPFFIDSGQPAPGGTSTA